jgi:superfamily II DNA or RNA helicase
VRFDGAASNARDTADAVFVTIQTLQGRGGDGLRARAWDYVVVDEFHHAEAERWKATLLGLDTRFLLGLTATPERADGRNVMDLCDGNVVFEVRLPEAIRMGALARFHYFGIADDDAVDYAALPRSTPDHLVRLELRSGQNPRPPVGAAEL